MTKASFYDLSFAKSAEIFALKDFVTLKKLKFSLILTVLFYFPFL